MAEHGISPEWKYRLTTPPDNWKSGCFINARGQRLPYGISLPVGEPAGHVMYVEGLGEPLQKTYELARDFNRHAVGFSVFDRMGQGLGGRFLQNKFKIHSQGFAQDAADLIRFVETVIPRVHKTTMLAHSTGGLVALLAYHQRPDLFTPPLITAPLLGLKDKIIGGREKQFGQLPLPGWIQEFYVPNGKDWQPRGTPGRLSPDAYSSHPERMHVHDFFPLWNKELRVGAPTIGWIWHACKAMTEVRTPEFLAALGPITLVTAGQDELVDNAPTLAALKHMKNATHIHMEDAKHEIPFEEDRHRSPLIKETLRLALNG